MDRNKWSRSSECAASAKDIKEATALRSFVKAGANARDAMIGDDLVDLEASGLSLGSLMVERLVNSGNASIQDSSHDSPQHDR